MPQEIQATEEQLNERFEIITAMIIEGVPQAEVVKRCLAEHPEWGVGRRMVYYYYNRVWGEMSQAANGLDRQAYYYLSVRQIDLMLNKAIRDSNMKAFDALMNTRMKLMGIRNTEDIDFSKDAADGGVDVAEFQRKLMLAAVGDDHEIE